MLSWAEMESIELEGQPLDLDLTLACGQAFRWCKREGEVWCGVVGDTLFELRTEGGVLYWRTFPDGREALVRDYLRLGDDVNSIYSDLSARDPYLGEVIRRFHGLRLLRQDPTECLLSFVCTTANNIPKITRSIDEMSRVYGELVCEQGNLCYYAFPRPERLARLEPRVLNSVGALGFRGEVLRSVSQHILSRGTGWLRGLREVDYAEARQQLLTIRGVGPKIADCVCLFSLDKDEAVPVDTHVRQIAARLFLPEMRAKSVTDGVYRQVVAAFHGGYGAFAGWAQQFLYYQDLLTPRRGG